MIDTALWFALGSWVAGCVLRALKLKRPLQALSIGGIPFHELSHLVACLVLGVRVKSITLLHHDDKEGFTGNVEPRDQVRNPFTALILAVAPAVGAAFWTALFAWGIGAVYEVGYDQAWAWLLLYLAVATGACAAPSGPDWQYAGHVIAQRPGQFLIGVGGSILAGWICWACGFPLAEWWHLALLIIAVLGSGVTTSKLYGWRRGA